MKYKFNPYERAVGIFITITIAGSLFFGVGLAVKKHWFEERVSYTTYVQSAANLREGSTVLMSGLKVGKIERIRLEGIGKIKVKFSVLKEYSKAITESSKVQFVRPFVLGDKALTLIPGVDGDRVLAAGGVLPVHESLDIMEVLSGKKLESMLSKVDNILNNLDQTMTVGKDIALEVGDKKKLKKTMDDLSFASAEVRKAIPMLTSKLPQASDQLSRTIENLAVITTSLREIQPEGTQKTIELLSESVVTLKGVQKSIFLRGNVEEARKEIEEQKGMPAGK